MENAFLFVCSHFSFADVDGDDISLCGIFSFYVTFLSISRVTFNNQLACRVILDLFKASFITITAALFDSFNSSWT